MNQIHLHFHWEQEGRICWTCRNEDTNIPYVPLTHLIILITVIRISSVDKLLTLVDAGQYF